MKSSLSLRDFLLALLVVAIWGSNFVVIKVALAALPPLLMAALRFTIVFIPAVFFLPRPKVSWANLVLYGVSLGAGQFGLLFIALNGYISPGLASLVVQMQVFFTIGLAMWRASARGAMWRSDRPETIAPHQVAAVALAVIGMVVIGVHNGRGVTLAGLVMTLLAGLFWAIANQAAREAASSERLKGERINMLAYVVWTSIFSILPLTAMSFLLEGWPAMKHGLTHASPGTWATVAWQSYANTLFGYTVWNWLQSRYSAATVTPMSLLVPVFGMGASALWLGEPLQDWKILASLLVMVGLALNLFWRRKTQAFFPRAAKPLAGEDVATGSRRSRGEL